MSVLRLILFLLIIQNLAVAQTKALLISNKTEIDSINLKIQLEGIQKLAEKYNLILDITFSLDDINFKKLSNYNSLVFYQFDINALSLQQSSDIMAFFKSGGGVCGIHDIFPTKSKWLWFDKVFENKIGIDPFIIPIDILSVLTIGKIDLPPLWKITDQKVNFKEIPKNKKTVLMNLGSSPIAWIGKTEFENYCFFSSLGGNKEVFQNPIYQKHIIGGILEVSKTLKIDSLKLDILPNINQFLVKTLDSSVQNANYILQISPTSILIKTDSGQLFRYNPTQKNTVLLGKFSQFEKSLGFKPDPEFEQNGIIYFFLKKEANKYLTKRFKLIENSLTFDDFEIESSSPNSNTFQFIKPEKEIDDYSLPKYYYNKVFKLDTNQTLLIETLNENSDVIENEPFVLDFNSMPIKSFCFNSNQELLILIDGKLKTVLFNNKQEFPPTANFVYKSLKYKVAFSAENIKKDNIYTWQISGKTIINPAIIYDFKKPGIYQVTLEVIQPNGMKDKIVKSIKL